MLVPEGNLTSWGSNWTMMLHQVSCNDTLLGCGEMCDIGSGGFDHLCMVEKEIFASSMTLLCTPCDYATCNVNVSLLLNGFESIQGVFLSRIPARDCNITSFAEQVSHSTNGETLKYRSSKESTVGSLTRGNLRIKSSRRTSVPKFQILEERKIKKTPRSNRNVNILKIQFLLTCNFSENHETLEIYIFECNSVI